MVITVPGDVGAQVGVVVGPGGGGLAADAADVGLLARMHLGNTQSAFNLAESPVLPSDGRSGSSCGRTSCDSAGTHSS